MLHKIEGVKGTGRWCGPSAICLVAGISYTQATALLREITGKRAIMGTTRSAVLEAFERLQYRWDAMALPDAKVPGGRLTLAHWLRCREGDDRRATFIVNVTRHWVVVQGNKAGDSETGGPVLTSEMGYRRAAVKAAYRLTPVK
jgi:hypothetical protein